MILTREQILAADDLELRRVETPEWGGVVYLRSMTGHERADFEEAVFTRRGKDQEVNRRIYLQELLARTLVGEDGARLFTSSDDIASLGAKKALVLMRLGEVAAELNGLSARDEQQLTANSGNVPPSPAL